MFFPSSGDDGLVIPILLNPHPLAIQLVAIQGLWDDPKDDGICRKKIQSVNRSNLLAKFRSTPWCHVPDSTFAKVKKVKLLVVIAAC